MGVYVEWLKMRSIAKMSEQGNNYCVTQSGAIRDHSVKKNDRSKE